MDVMNPYFNNSHRENEKNPAIKQPPAQGSGVWSPMDSNKPAGAAAAVGESAQPGSARPHGTAGQDRAAGWGSRTRHRAVRMLPQSRFLLVCAFRTIQFVPVRGQSWLGCGERLQLALCA